MEWFRYKKWEEHTHIVWLINKPIWSRGKETQLRERIFALASRKKEISWNEYCFVCANWPIVYRLKEIMFLLKRRQFGVKFDIYLSTSSNKKVIYFISNIVFIHLRHKMRLTFNLWQLNCSCFMSMLQLKLKKMNFGWEFTAYLGRYLWKV